MNAFAKPYVCTKCSLKIQRSLFLKLKTVRTTQNRQFSLKPHPQDGRPFRMAIIGSGPAGFYTAYKVLSKIENSAVDMYEQLPVPYGLVRFGVAPDHPEVKNCRDKFEEVAESPKFKFIGNISIGNEPGSLPLTTIAPHYDAILFAYGASKDRQLGIPGEDKLSGIYSARAFVGWYNGLPEYADLAPDFLQGEEAIVIGQGNVALDCARILLAPLDQLRKTDITEAAIEALSKSRIKSVKIVGRRGPLQAAFTIKEVREMMKLPDVAFSPMSSSLIPPNLREVARPQKRIMELLIKGSSLSEEAADKRWSLDFRLSPKSFNAETTSNQLSSISFEHTKLVPSPFDTEARAQPLGEFSSFPAQIAFRSIGYKSEALPGLSDLGVSFDDRAGVIPNDGYGRVVQPGGGLSGTSIHVSGMYCAGWVKRGPTGVIASTMADAFQTADVLAEDWLSHAKFIGGDISSKAGWDSLEAEADLAGCRRISWKEWQKIDAAEIERGRGKGKEREKFTKVEDMLAVL